MKNTLIALLLLGFGISSCTMHEMPVASGDSAYGLLSTKDMCDYYYPKQAGWTYVYKNTIQDLPATGTDVLQTITGPYDTVRTLGYQGLSPDGDTLYAVDITYRVLSQYAEKEPLTIYYKKQNATQTGGFISGNNPAGYATGTIDSITVTPATIDTILYAVDGPLRDIIDGYSGTGHYVRKDRIYYTSKQDSVVMWYREDSSSPLRRVRQLWYKSFNQNDDWQYSLWDNYTYFKVRDADMSLTTPAGTFTTAVIEVKTEAMATPVMEFKYWGYGTGLIKQTDEWRITTDGSTYTRRSKVRELVSKAYTTQ